MCLQVSTLVLFHRPFVVKKILNYKKILTFTCLIITIGFTLPTTLCQVYTEHKDLPTQVWEDVEIQMQRVEKDMKRIFGDKQNPLLVSVRSGAAISMPGEYPFISCKRIFYLSKIKIHQE